MHSDKLTEISSLLSLCLQHMDIVVDPRDWQAVDTWPSIGTTRTVIDARHQIEKPALKCFFNVKSRFT